MEKKEVVFSQSAAVTRCRGVKEAKLKGQYALVKLADEEGAVVFTYYFYYDILILTSLLYNAIKFR